MSGYGQRRILADCGHGRFASGGWARVQGRELDVPHMMKQLAKLRIRLERQILSMWMSAVRGVRFSLACVLCSFTELEVLASLCPCQGFVCPETGSMQHAWNGESRTSGSRPWG